MNVSVSHAETHEEAGSICHGPGAHGVLSICSSRGSVLQPCSVAAHLHSHRECLAEMMVLPSPFPHQADCANWAWEMAVTVA